MLAEKTNNAISLLKEIEANGPAAFACSFGAEDMVLLDLIDKHARRIEVFTLDTGRLPEETHALLDKVREVYAVPIRIYFPDSGQIEKWVEQNGANAFYRSVAQRKQCCQIRKVLPLKRALAGMNAWITGLRREQSDVRSSLRFEEWDDVNGLKKFNLLFDWTLDDVWAYIRQNHVQYNALHDKGYPSIGCAPCTRAVEPGEDFRSGRWWWEAGSARECGLHPPAEVQQGGLAHE